MPSFIKEPIKWVAGEDIDLLGRVVRRVNGSNELPADDGSDYSSFEFRIYSTGSRNPIYEVTGIDPATVIGPLVFDDEEWTKGGGRNFLYSLLASDLATARVDIKPGAGYTLQGRLVDRTLGPRFLVWRPDVLSPAS